MKPQLRLLALASASISLGTMICAPARAEEFEQHGAHEHGKITINVALEKQELSIELDAPAVNVVGFEHVPRTAQEKAAVASAAALLKSESGLFGMPDEARCHLNGSQINGPHWEKDDGHDGDHEHADAHEQHADYEASYNFKCEAPAQLGWFEPWLLDKLPNVHEARINLITATGQRSQVVSRAHERVLLQGER
jgi:hypothetical protein